MTYIEIINSYWDSTKFDNGNPIDAAVYLFLVHQCNQRRWNNPFEFKTRNLEVRFGLTRKAIASIRNRLKQHGLIDFVPGIAKRPSVYKICAADVTDPDLDSRFNVSSGNIEGNIKETLGKHQGNGKETATASDTSYIEEKRYKKKDNNIKGRDQIHSIFGEDDFERWKDAVCSRFKIPEENLSRLAAQFAEEAACRGWTIGPAEKSTRSLFTSWLERRVSKQKSNNFNPQQYGTNHTWYRPQGLAARMPHKPMHGLIE